MQGDLLAGVTVAGQWAILPPLLLYALVGPSPQLSVGDAAQYASLDSLLALFVGLVCFVGPGSDWGVSR